MEITITQLERDTSDNSVTSAHWSASVTDGEHSASIQGIQSFIGDSTAPDFTIYKDLTEATVIGWLNIPASIEDNLIAEVAEQKAPIMASGVPWTTKE